MKKKNLPLKIKLLQKVEQNDQQRQENFQEIETEMQVLNPKSLQELEKEIEQSKKIIIKKVQILNHNKKVMVGDNYALQVTQFFNFKREKQETGNETIFDEIAGGRIAWFILLYAVCNTAITPCWNIHIQATKYLRHSWRFFMQTFLIIPFVLHEYRTSDESVKQKYQLSFIFKVQNFKKAYLNALATSFYLTMIATCNQIINISHSLTLGSLSNFFLSLRRSSKGSAHNLQPGGQILIIIGIILIFVDSLTFQQSSASQEYFNYKNTKYLEKTNVERFAFDIVALLTGFCMSKFSLYTDITKQIFPPYLLMMIVNFMVCINMSLVSYFLNGTTFNFDNFWGLFSIFSQNHFVSFVELSIILCMGMILSSIMLVRLFPNTIIPSLAMAFEPLFCTCFLDITGCQKIPGVFSFLGFLILIPGKFLILSGQWMFSKKTLKEEKEERVRLSSLTERYSRISSKIKLSTSRKGSSAGNSPIKIKKQQIKT